MKILAKQHFMKTLWSTKRFIRWCCRNTYFLEKYYALYFYSNIASKLKSSVWTWPRQIRVNPVFHDPWSWSNLNSYKKCIALRLGVMYDSQTTNGKQGGLPVSTPTPLWCTPIGRLGVIYDSKPAGIQKNTTTNRWKNWLKNRLKQHFFYTNL